MEPLIEEWKKQDVKVFQTRGIQYVWELIQENDVVTVIGSSGCGKTVAVQHTALKLQSQGYRIVPVRSPKEIKDYFYAEYKQVFVCNDVCGKYTIDLQVVNEWERYSEDIRLILNSKFVKILCSCKTRIFQNSTFQRIDILTLKTCDLLSSKYSLTPSERTQIAALYLTVDEVVEIKVLDLYKRYDFFPILCEYYSRNKTGDIKKFFTCPVQVIREELSGLMKRDDQTVYATLAFFVIYNNCIPDSMLSKGSETRHIREEIADICKMPYVFSGQVLKLQIESLNGCYVNKIGNAYSIIHDKIFDIVVEFYGSHMFDIVLEHCHTEIVRDRFQFESVTEDDNNCIIKVPANKEQMYFNRICKDIRDGHISNVFTNRQLKHVSYREKFIEHIKTTDVHKILQSVAKTQSPLLTVAALGYSDITDLLIRLSLDVNVQDEKGRTPLMLATIKALLLLEDNTDLNICTTGNLQPLYADSCQGFIECVKLLLKYGANPDICDSNGRFPLLLASGEKYEDFVKLLLDYGCNPDLIDSEGNTSLIMASSWGNDKIVQELLNQHCNPDLNGENTDPPLHVALTHGHLNIAEMLLQHNCNSCILNRNKEPSFYVAAKKGYTDLLKKIIEHSNIDDIYRHSASSLQAAITRNEIEVVKVLLAYNCFPLLSYKSALLNQALQSDKEEIVHVLLQNNFHENLFDSNVGDIDQVTDWGKSTMSKLEKNQYHILYDLSEPMYSSNTGFKLFCHFKSNPTRINTAELLSNEKKWFPFIAACRQGNVDNLNSYPNTEINKMIDMYNINQETSLLVASELGHTQIVKFLLENKCNPDLCNKDNESPLYVASKRGHTDVVKLLLVHKCNPDLCNKYKQSPLHVASERGHTEIVKLLLEQICSPDLCNKDHVSALNEASKRGHTEIVKLLLEQTCSLDLCNKNNVSPLYVASKGGHIGIVKLLLEHKCNPDPCNYRDESPLYVASEGGHIEIVKLLLEHKCNPDLCNMYKESPLYVASKKRPYRDC